MQPGAKNDSPSLRCKEYFTCGQTFETCHFTGKTSACAEKVGTGIWTIDLTSVTVITAMLTVCESFQKG